MDKFREFAYRHPIMTSIIAIGIFTCLTEIPQLEPLLLNYFDKQSASYLAGTIIQGLTSLLLVIVMAYFKLIKTVGFSKPPEWKQVLIAWPILALSLLASWSLFTGVLVIDMSKPLHILFYMLVYLSTGFYEEILCRGLVLSLLLNAWGQTKKGLSWAVIISSLLFGIIHLVSLLLGRISFLASLTQVGYATFIGVFFAACILRNRSLWPAIIGHAIFNMSSDLNTIAIGGTFGEISTTNSTLSDALSTIIIMFPFLVYGLFILRKVQPLNNSTANIT